MEELRGPDEELIGAITRNRYGALVLNSASLFIADIDAAPAPGFLGRLMARFGRPVKDKAYRLAAVQRFAEQNPALCLLIYETHSGLRVFIVNESIAPDSGRAAELLYLGRSMSADEGHAWGFFNQVVPANDLDQTAGED